MQPQTPLGLLDATFDPLRQTRRGTRLALGEACTADSHCMSHVCRCPSTYRRRPQFCTETGKVCTELLPVGAECDDNRRVPRHLHATAHPPAARSVKAVTSTPAAQTSPGRKCISHKCYCAKDPWNREQCAQGPRKCCYWSWGYWECEGSMVEEMSPSEQLAAQGHTQGSTPSSQTTAAQTPLELPHVQTPVSS